MTQHTDFRISKVFQLKLNWTTPLLLVGISFLLLIAGCSKKAKPQDAGGDASVSNQQTEGEGNDNDKILKILTGQTDVSAPDGWKIIDSNSFDCKIAWPEANELSESSTVKLDNGNLIFSFGTGERSEQHQKDYTLESVANMMEAGIRVGNQKIISKSTTKDRLFIRDIANQNDKFTMFGRVFVGQSRFWVITTTFPNGNVNDERIKYFFQNFALKK